MEQSYEHVEMQQPLSILIPTYLGWVEEILTFGFHPKGPSSMARRRKMWQLRREISKQTWTALSG